MRIDIEVDGQTFDLQADAFMRKALEPAIVDGINATAKLIQDDLIEAAGRNFDSPNAFTLRAFGVLPARASAKREPNAMVLVKDKQAAYLELQIDGGVRRAGDYATTAKGPLVPGPDARLNKNGNLPRGYVRRMLAREDVFWVDMGVTNRPTLVQRTKGNDLKILAMIVEKTEYREKFDFFGIVEASAGTHLNEQLVRAIDAIRTTDGA